MASGLVSPEDFSLILNMMGKYQHLVDGMDAEGWVALFTEDGAFLGLPGENGSVRDFHGREELKEIPNVFVRLLGGKMRHNMCSFSAEYGESTDEAFARYYVIGTVAMPEGGVQVTMQVDVYTHLVKIGGEWKIKSNRMALV